MRIALLDGQADSKRKGDGRADSKRKGVRMALHDGRADSKRKGVRMALLDGINSDDHGLSKNV